MKNEMEKQGVWLFRFRGTLPLIILVLGVCEYIITRIDNPTYVINGASSPQLIHYEILCFVVSLLGLAVRAFTVGYTPANTSGRNVAEQVADQLIAGGIKGIWNFAPTHLDVPPNILVQYENMATSLAVLSVHLQAQIKEEKEVRK